MTSAEASSILDRLIGVELDGLTQGEGHGVGVVLVILDEVELLVIALLEGNDIQLVENGRLVSSEDVVGGLSEGSLLAQHVIDDGTRSAASTETREAILVGSVLVSLLDGGIYIGGRDGDRSGKLRRLARQKR